MQGTAVTQVILFTSFQRVAIVRSLSRFQRVRDDIAWGLGLSWRWDYFLREAAGGTVTIARRIGTIAPFDGSAAAPARDSTSCWMAFTKS